MDKSGNWTIELAERDLGIPGDSLLFGRDASHSFLRMKDEFGQVVGELHGRAWDPCTGKFGKMLKVSSLFNQGVQGVGNFLQKNLGINTGYIRGFFDAYAREHEVKLKVDIRGDGKTFEPEKPDTFSTIVDAPRERVKMLWEQATEKAIQINGADLEYRPIELAEPAQNCHSVAMDLGEIVTGNPITPQVRKEQKFAMPGWSTHLDVGSVFNSLPRALRMQGVSMEAVPV
jgi:hypothetical protein